MSKYICYFIVVAGAQLSLSVIKAMMIPVIPDTQSHPISECSIRKISLKVNVVAF